LGITPVLLCPFSTTPPVLSLGITPACYYVFFNGTPLGKNEGVLGPKGRGRKEKKKKKGKGLHP
jgi:hypothetical protein